MPLAKRTRTNCNSYNERIHALRSTPTTHQELMCLKTQSPSHSHTHSHTHSLPPSLTHTHTHTHKDLPCWKYLYKKGVQGFRRAKGGTRRQCRNRKNHSSMPNSLAAAQNAYKLLTNTETESLG